MLDGADSDRSLEDTSGCLMADCVDNAAAVGTQLDLIRAHPDLAGKTQVAQVSSRRTQRSEQSRAGLDQCSALRSSRSVQDAEHSSLSRQRFDFPFIMAVQRTVLEYRDTCRPFARRIENDYGTLSLKRHLQEIHKIARLRLAGSWRGNSDDAVRNIRFYHWIQSRAATTRYACERTPLMSSSRQKTASSMPSSSRCSSMISTTTMANGWTAGRAVANGHEGHDYCVIRLGVPGVIRGFRYRYVSFFTGNLSARSVHRRLCISDRRCSRRRGMG